jgi:hypothetical protein
MNHTQPEGSAMRRIGYQNAVLTLIALCLGVGLVERAAAPGLTEPAAAHAQPAGDDQGGLSNKLEQGKQMISELHAIGVRLDRLEAKLSSGISVKVTEMPPLKLPPEARPKADGEKPKAESKIEVKPAEGK